MFDLAKPCLCKLILFLVFSQFTPLHDSAIEGSLEICRLLVESKADVAARNRCFSPPLSHHLSFTICLTAVAKLHSHWPSPTAMPTLLHTSEASARLNDALPRPAPPRCPPACCVFARSRQIKYFFFFVSRALRGKFSSSANGKWQGVCRSR
jgi:hypothetical protein